MSNQSNGIYVHGEIIVESPTHGGLIPVHGYIYPRHGLNGSGPVSPTLNELSLSVSSVAESASIGTPVGSLQDVTPGSGLSLIDDAGGLFQLVDDEVQTAGALDYETAASHNITVRETYVGATNDPNDTILAITVTNVAEVTLNALSLSVATVAENASVGTIVGAVQNASSGSTVTLFDNAGGRFALVAGNIEVASPLDYETATNHDITLRETHTDGTNSPRDSVINIVVTDVAENLNALSLDNSTIAEDAIANDVVGALQGLTGGSTLSLVDDAGGRFALSGTNVVRGATGLDYETATNHNITVRETLAAAGNSPRDTIINITVSNVAETTLAALSLSASTVSEGASIGTVVGAIQNTTAGSTLSLQDSAGGLFAVVGSNIEVAAALDYETATSHNITIRETHADGINSPRDTVVAITVTDVLDETAAMFAGAEAGAIFDPSNLASMFQQSDGTVAAAVDSPVGYIDDLSPNSNTATQATAGARPTLRQDGGGRNYLEFDGTADFLNILSLYPLAANFTLVAAFKPTYAGSSANRPLIYASSTTAKAMAVYPNHTAGGGAGGLRVWNDSDKIIENGTDQNGVAQVLTVHSRAGRHFARRNGASIASNTLGGAISGSASAMTIGNQAGSVFVKGDLYWIMLINRELTAGEIESVETLAASKIGI